MWFRKAPKLDEYGRSPLHYAAGDGDLAAVRKHLKAGADASAADRAGWTPLHFAAQAQAAEIVRALIEKGANVEAEDRHGNTPLSTAVSKYLGDPATVDHACVEADHDIGRRFDLGDQIFGHTGS